jgi:hypothetical protein
MKKIPMYVESKNGHDTLDVPDDELQEEVEEQLNEDKWATLEHNNGTTDILTQSDVPKSQEQEWADKFKCVKSVTVTNKAKGG